MRVLNQVLRMKKPHAKALLAALLLTGPAFLCRGASMHSFSRTSLLPDTGQLTVLASGDDASYAPANAQPSYTKYMLSSEEVTLDHRTGLMWAADGAAAGCAGGGLLTWVSALNQCESLSFAGFSDWRLPDIRELMSIVNYGAGTPPAVNTAYFPNTVSNYYWSSTTYLFAPSYAWSINFSDGMFITSVLGNQKTNTNYLRCVRAGP